MQALRAYNQASATWNQASCPPRQVSTPQTREKTQSGDFLNFSAEARAMAAKAYGAGSICPQDATYDNSGHVTRQLDNLQSDLRHLSSQLINIPGGSGLIQGVTSLQSRLAGIQACV